MLFAGPKVFTAWRPENARCEGGESVQKKLVRVLNRKRSGGAQSKRFKGLRRAQLDLPL